MLRFLGAVFISVLLALGILVLDYISKSDFIADFARNQSLLIMATALAINIATITFIAGSLLGIEEKVGKESFKGTRAELKQNVIAMAVLFVINAVVVTLINPHKVNDDLVSMRNALAALSLTIVFSFGALILETSMLVLRIKAHNTSGK